MNGFPSWISAPAALFALLIAPACYDPAATPLRATEGSEWAPAPAGETAPPRTPRRAAEREVDRSDPIEKRPPVAWTPQELAAYALLKNFIDAQTMMQRKVPLERLAAAAPAAAQEAFKVGGIVAFDGYCYRVVLSATDGRPVADDNPSALGDEFAIYAWPENGRGRVFCGSASGVLFAQHGGAYVGKGGGPTVDAALSISAKRTLVAGLKGARVGRDGLRWQEVEQPRSEFNLRLKVVDRNGIPLPGFEVMVVPRSWLLAANKARKSAAPQQTQLIAGVFLPDLRAHVIETGDRLLPVGRAKSSLEGRIVLRGVAAKGMVLVSAEKASDVDLLPDAEGLLLQVKAQTTAKNLRLANERRAWQFMRAIASAQAEFSMGTEQDADGDDIGEYGYLGELMGTAPLRTGTEGTTGRPRARLSVNEALRATTVSAIRGAAVEHEGYLFQVWLPGENGKPLREHPEGGSAGLTVNADLAEIAWFAYAWPVEHGKTGDKAFFTGSAGEVYEADNIATKYSGPSRRPAATAAHSPAWKGDPFITMWEMEMIGSDGNHWRAARR